MKWVSSFDNDFNRDYHVSFTDEARAQQRAYYNYALSGFPVVEAPDLVPKGRDEDGLSSTMEWLRHHDRYEGEVIRVPGGLKRPAGR
jgi:predicted dithiol-disulfide oxidoreductase (DUF899 family)